MILAFLLLFLLPFAVLVFGALLIRNYKYWWVVLTAQIVFSGVSLFFLFPVTDAYFDAMGMKFSSLPDSPIYIDALKIQLLIYFIYACMIYSITKKNRKNLTAFERNKKIQKIGLRFLILESSLLVAIIMVLQAVLEIKVLG